MFRCSSVTLYRGEVPILYDASFHATAGNVVGIVGDNGVGKTSLLQAIAGRLPLESGTIQAGTVASLTQDTNPSQTIEHTHPELEYWQLQYALSLAEVNATPETPLATLSGGQRTRVGLAAIVVREPQPHVLLLDEPTNNLDTEGISWLQKIIRQFGGVTLLVSHDRALLDAVCTHIVELKNHALTTYCGNFSDYVTAREQERSLQHAAYVAQEDQKKRLQRQIRTEQARATSAKRTPRKDNDKMLHDASVMSAEKSAGSKLKALKSKLARVSEVAPPERIIAYRSSLDGEVLAHRQVVTVEELSFHYETAVLQKVSLSVQGPERVHIAGRNGSGKSTLLKLLAGRLHLQQGTIQFGADIAVGYFSQDADQLHNTLPLAQQIHTETKAEQTALYENARALGLLPHELQKSVGNLSRGQRAKAALLELLINNYHLLLLDEPTNHLDIRTRELLEDALQRYKGAIIFASHDAYFAQKIATKKLSLGDK